ncbi:hypothetical protein [Spiroplasma endosymbiont of Sarcophaga variegata]
MMKLKKLLGDTSMLGEDIYEYLEVLKHQISQRKKVLNLMI